MLSKVRRAMNEQSKNFNRDKLFLKYFFKVLNKNHRAKDYNNRAEKFNREVQEQTRSSNRKDQ